MANVAIKKIQESEAGAISLFAESEKTAEAIRQRAFEYFLGRGGAPGADLEDWLRAERELIWSPGAEMTENDRDVTLRVQAPGFEPAEIQITATPDSMLVEAETSHTHEDSKGKVHFCEFTRTLFRRFDLPEAINVDKVSATLDKGILRIVATKAEPAQKDGARPVTAANAAA